MLIVSQLDHAKVDPGLVVFLAAEVKRGWPAAG